VTAADRAVAQQRCAISGAIKSRESQIFDLRQPARRSFVMDPLKWAAYAQESFRQVAGLNPNYRCISTNNTQAAAPATTPKKFVHIRAFQLKSRAVQR
jgi:hypothetical protein